MQQDKATTGREFLLRLSAQIFRCLLWLLQVPQLHAEASFELGSVGTLYELEEYDVAHFTCLASKSCRRTRSGLRWTASEGSRSSPAGSLQEGDKHGMQTNC